MEKFLCKEYKEKVLYMGQKVGHNIFDDGDSAKIWAVGGGKGGTGKSIVATNIAVQLSRRQKKVVIIDADLGGGNVHTYLGIRPPTVSLADFLRNKVSRLEDVMVSTPFERLKLISDANEVLGLANTNYLQKEKVLRCIKNLKTDYVIIDLGAGTSYNILDFFLLSNRGFLVSVPEPASIENAYRFIRSALHRKLIRIFNKDFMKSIFEKIMYPKYNGIKTIYDLVEQVEKEDRSVAERLVQEITSFRPKLIMNQIRNNNDIILGDSITDLSKKYLGVKLKYIGYVSYDDRLKTAAQKRLLLFSEFPNCGAAICIRNIVDRLIEEQSNVQKGGINIEYQRGKTTQLL